LESSDPLHGRDPVVSPPQASTSEIPLCRLDHTGPEVEEGLASHLEKRKPAFPPGSVL
jgi:hypothetical protein